MTHPSRSTEPSLDDAAVHGPSAQGSEIRALFDSVAPRYDLLNFLMSGGLDRWWRRRTRAAARLAPGDAALDVCTGTGDLARAFRRAVGASGTVVGVDFSPEMLALARAKGVTSVVIADALALPFASDTFAAAAVAFGIRNVHDPAAALQEMARVVRPGGRVLVLEFSLPRNPVIGAIYRIYLRHGVPLLGRIVSGRKEAYGYLARSVPRFLRRVDLEAAFRSAGLSVEARPRLCFGVVELLVGVKPVGDRPRGERG